MLDRDQYREVMRGNLEFWRGWSLPMDEYTRNLLAQDIAAARYRGDTEAEQELLAFQQAHR